MNALLIGSIAFLLTSTALAAPSLSPTPTAPSATKPIFSPELVPAAKRDRAYFRSLRPEMSDADFALLWSETLDRSALKLLRTFPISFYDDLRKSADGPIGMCFGDPHIENFGFILFSEGPRFVFNDFDSSWYCPVKLDALYAFTTIQLYEKDASSTNLAIAEYMKALAKGASTEFNPSELGKMKSEKQRKKRLREFTKDKKLIRSAELEEVADPLPIKKALLPLKSLNGFSILDLVRAKRELGGSAGATRYVLLVENPLGEKEILELKEVKRPDTAVGDWKPLVPHHLEVVRSILWQGLTSPHFDLVEIEGKEFLLRSRTTKKLNPDDLSSKERRYLYSGIARIVAQEHKQYIAPSKEYETWLAEGAVAMANRYRAIRAAAKNAVK